MGCDAVRMSSVVRKLVAISAAEVLYEHLMQSWKETRARWKLVASGRKGHRGCDYSEGMKASVVVSESQEYRRSAF